MLTYSLRTNENKGKFQCFVIILSKFMEPLLLMAIKDPKGHYIQYPQTVRIKFIVVYVKIFSYRDRDHIHF